MTVTVAGYNDPTGFADWSSTLPVHGVYVKGGPSGGDLFGFVLAGTIFGVAVLRSITFCFRVIDSESPVGFLSNALATPGTIRADLHELGEREGRR